MIKIVNTLILTVIVTAALTAGIISFARGATKIEDLVSHRTWEYLTAAGFDSYVEDYLADADLSTDFPVYADDDIVGAYTGDSELIDWAQDSLIIAVSLVHEAARYEAQEKNGASDESFAAGRELDFLDALAASWKGDYIYYFQPAYDNALYYGGLEARTGDIIRHGALGLTFLDEVRRPRTDITVKLALPDGREVLKSSDAQGRVSFYLLPPSPTNLYLAVISQGGREIMKMYLFGGWGVLSEHAYIIPSSSGRISGLALGE